jgi:hypothetical protein
MPIESQEFIPPRLFRLTAVTDSVYINNDGAREINMIADFEHNILVPISLARSPTSGRGVKYNSFRLSYRIISGGLSSMTAGVLRNTFTAGASISTTAVGITSGTFNLSPGTNINNVDITVDSPIYENADTTSSVIINFIITIIASELTVIELYGLDVFHSREASVLASDFETRLTTVENQLTVTDYVLPTITPASATAPNNWPVAIIGSPTNCTINSGSGFYLSGNNWVMGWCTINLTQDGVNSNFYFNISYPPVPISSVPTHVVGACGGVNGSLTVVGGIEKDPVLVNGIGVFCQGHAITGTTGTFDLNIWMVAAPLDINGSADLDITSLTVSGRNDITVPGIFTARIDEVTGSGTALGSVSGDIGHIIGIVQGTLGHPSAGENANNLFFNQFAGSVNVKRLEFNTASGTSADNHLNYVVNANFTSPVGITFLNNQTYLAYYLDGYMWIMTSRIGNLAVTLNSDVSFEIIIPPGYTIDGDVWGVCAIQNSILFIPSVGSTNKTIKFTSYIQATTTVAQSRLTFVVMFRVTDV